MLLIPKNEIKNATDEMLKLNNFYLDASGTHKIPAKKKFFIKVYCKYVQCTLYIRYSVSITYVIHNRSIEVQIGRYYFIFDLQITLKIVFFNFNFFF